MLLSVALLAVTALCYYAFFLQWRGLLMDLLHGFAGEAFHHGDVIIIISTKWEFEVKYLRSASKWPYSFFFPSVAAEQDFLSLFGPKVFAFALSVLLRAFFFLHVSHIFFYLLIFYSCLHFLLQPYMRLFVMFMSWSDLTEVCLTVLNVLLMPNCQVQNYNVPHNPGLHNEWNKICCTIFLAFPVFFLVKPCSLRFHSGTGLCFHTGPPHGIIFGISCVFKLKEKL